MKKTACSACLLALGLWNGILAAQETVVVRISQPGENEILYGKTRVVAEVRPASTVAQVVFYLDRFERPICGVTTAPYVCEFDAGTDFQGRRIRAVARDAAGRPLGEEVVETLAFPRPERVVQYLVRVPVVVSSAEEVPDLDGLECLYGGRPCRVLGAERMELTLRTPLSVELLVDVSPSVTTNRAELLEVTDAVIDAFPDHAAITIAEFAGNYRSLGPFTADRQTLRTQVQGLSANVARTCLLRALDRALVELKHRPGHRALFVVSDGIDTCDSKPVRVGPGIRMVADEGVLYHAVELARSVGAAIYIYRLAGPSPPGGLMIFGSGAHEGLARETGGRLFTTGDLYGMAPAFADLIEDVRSSWMVDVALPRQTQAGGARRLELVPADEDGLRLRYPMYWEPDARESAWMAQLESDIPEVRLDAARALADSVTPEVLRALLSVLPREPEAVIREAELQALEQLSARLLVHGQGRQRKLALDAIETLQTLSPERFPLLRPALEVFRKLDVPARLIRRAERLVGAVE